VEANWNADEGKRGLGVKAPLGWSILGTGVGERERDRDRQRQSSWPYVRRLKRKRSPGERLEFANYARSL
jgi:hypothetical protein